MSDNELNVPFLVSRCGLLGISLCAVVVLILAMLLHHLLCKMHAIITWRSYQAVRQLKSNIKKIKL